MDFGLIVGGIVALVLVAMGLYERVQAWSRDHAGRLYVGIWAAATVLVVIVQAGFRGGDLTTSLVVGVVSGIFAAFGTWLFLVGFNYEVNRRDGEKDQPTSRGPFG